MMAGKILDTLEDQFVMDNRVRDMRRDQRCCRIGFWIMMMVVMVVMVMVMMMAGCRWIRC